MSLGLELEHARAFLRHRHSVAIRELPGFERGRHRLPSGAGRGAEQFVHERGAEALAEDLRVIYEQAKAVLGLRRRQLVRALAEGGGNIDTPQFRYAIELSLDPDDPRRALWQRRVVLLLGPRALPPSFDSVFPVPCDELVVPFAVPPDTASASGFDLVVDRLEDFAELHGGRVQEDEDAAKALLTTPDGSSIALDLRAQELTLRCFGVDGCRALLLEAEQRFAELVGPILAALE